MDRVPSDSAPRGSKASAGPVPRATPAANLAEITAAEAADLASIDFTGTALLARGERGKSTSHSTSLSGSTESSPEPLSHRRPARLPPEVQAAVKKDMDRLRRIPKGSEEAMMLRTHLNALWSMPWEERSGIQPPLEDILATLRGGLCGKDKFIQRAMEDAAVRQQIPDWSASPTLLLGPKKTGKTTAAEVLARALNRPLARINMAELELAEDLLGRERSLPGAHIGKLAEALCKVRTNDPVIAIDKGDSISNQAMLEALLGILDSKNRGRFVDRYIEVPIDLSRAIYILMAESSGALHSSLEESLDVIPVPSYSDSEKIEVANRFIIPQQLAAHRLDENDLKFPDETLREIIARYTLEPGVKAFARTIRSACRKVSVAKMLGEAAGRSPELLPENLENFFGPREYNRERPDQVDQIGVAWGLAYSSSGGEVLASQARRTHGPGGFVVTGQVGSVMQESAHVAYTIVCEHADLLGIPEEAFNDRLHLHFPAGGVPKDGPSAGIAITLAIGSALSRRKIRHDIAFTGEIDLRGRGCPVGGIREKALAALRVGFKVLVLPGANESAISELPQEVREGLSMCPIDDIEEVFALALCDPEAEEPAAGRIIMPGT